MHGMLSAAVMLAAFAVIALVSGASAVWLFRAAAATPGRSRSARPAGTPGAGAAPGTPGASGAPGEPEEDADATDTDYSERTWLGVASPGTAPLTGPVTDGRWPGPDPAGTPGAGHGYDVYDVEDWPGEGAGDGRDGPNGPGRSSPGARGWPDTAKSLYSRGWPVMDSPPHGPDPERPGNGPEDGPDTGPSGEPDAGPSDAAEAGAPERPGGARVYVLDESRRPGR